MGKRQEDDLAYWKAHADAARDVRLARAYRRVAEKVRQAGGYYPLRRTERAKA